MSVHKVFVDGQEGTTGLQIDEYLRRRSDVTVLRIDPALRKDPAERARLLNAADVAFLCLFDAAARESVALVDNPATCVIDTSTAPTNTGLFLVRRERISAVSWISLLRPMTGSNLPSRAS